MPNNEPSGEIRISESILHKLGMLFLGTLAGFVLLGALVSPRDEQGNPVLLSPDVNAVQDYRSSARGWMEKLSLIDSEVSRIVSAETQGDLFTQSQSAQRILQQTVGLAQQIDRTNVPPIAMGLHDEQSSTALAYVEAARSALQWVSAPGQDNHDQAVQKLEAARKLKDQLEGNQWLTSP